MEVNNQTANNSKPGPSFFIEAAIDERGPQQLEIIPSFHQYLVYSEGNMCACIQLNDEGEWELIDGQFSNGVVRIIGQEIMRVRRT
ncbi:MAG: hypothetical protein H7Y13_04535 [Sphingobacteriaceae bacterium]|nr:hypothetical protein [Sphingobacteriaceae bacterium]